MVISLQREREKGEEKEENGSLRARLVGHVHDTK